MICGGMRSGSMKAKTRADLAGRSVRARRIAAGAPRASEIAVPRIAVISVCCAADQFCRVVSTLPSKLGSKYPPGANPSKTRRAMGRSESTTTMPINAAKHASSLPHVLRLRRRDTTVAPIFMASCARSPSPQTFSGAGGQGAMKLLRHRFSISSAEQCGESLLHRLVLAGCALQIDRDDVEVADSGETGRWRDILARRQEALFGRQLLAGFRQDEADEGFGC